MAQRHILNYFYKKKVEVKPFPTQTRDESRLFDYSSYGRNKEFMNERGDRTVEMGEKKGRETR